MKKGITYSRQREDEEMDKRLAPTVLGNEKMKKRAASTSLRSSERLNAKYSMTGPRHRCWTTEKSKKLQQPLVMRIFSSGQKILSVEKACLLSAFSCSPFPSAKSASLLPISSSSFRVAMARVYCRFLRPLSSEIRRRESVIHFFIMSLWTSKTPVRCPVLRLLLSDCRRREPVIHFFAFSLSESRRHQSVTNFFVFSFSERLWREPFIHYFVLWHSVRRKHTNVNHFFAISLSERRSRESFIHFFVS